MIKKGNTRIQHTLSKSLLDKVETSCAKNEIDRRVWINLAIKEKLSKEEKNERNKTM